jgi:glutamate/tyrosine decarboxylase-like PLP-dependent enzyme
MDPDDTFERVRAAASGKMSGMRPWSADEVRRVGYRVIDLIADYLDRLPDGPVFRPVPRDLAGRFLSMPAPVAGTDADGILDEFTDVVAPYPFGNGHPRFWGWVNSPPVAIGALAEALAAAMNPSCAGGNHAAIYVERQVLNWFKEILGFPRDSMGLLVSGGSMASLTALAVARHARAGYDVRREGLQAGRPRLVCYVSEEGHGCLRKAAELMGIGEDNVRTVAVDAGLRMRVDDLEAKISDDLAAGRRPFAVAASAGTVNTGAIDPLADIAAVCRRFGLWFHVDGAYGAVAILSRHYRDELMPIALADSVALDPHKWLSIPVEAGLVLVKDGQAMRDAFSLVPPYLRTDGSLTGVGGLPWFSEYGLQQTRGFRALKIWMALKHYGLAGYARAIEEHIELARYLYERIRATADLEAVTAPGLSIVCFRYAPPALRRDPKKLDSVNQSLLERIQLGGEAFVSSTVIGGVFVLRACIINYLTRRADLDALVDLVVREGRALAA